MDIFEDLKNYKFVFNKNDYVLFSQPVGHPYPHSEESKILMSMVKKGKHDSEYYRQLALKRKNFKQTDNQKKIVTDKLSLEWQITSPNGKSFVVKNLNKFCKENNLDQGNMSRNLVKGWTCKKII